MQGHIPVLSREVIKYLAPQKDQNFIDATVGLGGHAKMILEKTSPKGKLLAIDQDPVAIEEAQKNLKNYGNRITFINSNFDEIGLLVRKWPVSEIFGILFDLGTSSYQLSSERGFSFQQNNPLDMRMSPNINLTAEKIINQWPAEKIRQIIWQYGEEPMAAAIAREIVTARKARPIRTTGELVKVIEKAIHLRERTKRKMHFATLTFQALRIAVNDELRALENGLKQALQILSPGGRIVVISFHSLEDRIVKQFFRGNPNLEILTPKPVAPSEKEIDDNPRARSAKLRAARKINSKF